MLNKIPIPKIIWTIWLSEDGSIPDLIKSCTESQKMPGYEHRLITLDNCFKDSKYMQECLNSPHKTKKWCKASDYLRMHYLLTEGGIYLDADVGILEGRNFDDMLEARMFVGMENNNVPGITVLGTAVIGAEPNHPLIKLWKDIAEANFRGDDDKCYESSMDILNIQGVHYQDTFRLYPPEYFFPYNWQTGIINVTQNTRTFHHFLKSWNNTSDLLPKVSIIIPQLGREEGLKKCLESIDRLYYPKHLIETIVVEGKETVPQKVANGLAQSNGDIICYAANDMIFEPNSLYEAVKMSKDHGLVSFNSGVGLLPDSGYLCEHFIIRKDFIPRIGEEIFDTEFHHVGVDQLLWAKANKLKQAIMCKDAVINHNHFSRGKAEQDDIYQKGWSQTGQDRELLKKKLAELGK